MGLKTKPVRGIIVAARHHNVHVTVTPVTDDAVETQVNALIGAVRLVGELGGSKLSGAK